jgi:hypothetical protein
MSSPRTTDFPVRRVGLTPRRETMRSIFEGRFFWRLSDFGIDHRILIKIG